MLLETAQPLHICQLIVEAVLSFHFLAEHGIGSYVSIVVSHKDRTFKTKTRDVTCHDTC